MDQFEKGEISSTTTTLVPESLHSSTNASTSKRESVSTIFHIRNEPKASFKVMVPNLRIFKSDMTPLYDVTRHGGFWPGSNLAVTDINQSDTTFAEITDSSREAKGDGHININMKATNQLSKDYTLSLRRDGGSLKRRYHVTLSDGRTFTLDGKHSSNLLWCWGNLKITEEDGKIKLAEFKSEWPTSFSKWGTVTLLGDLGETIATEMLMVMLAIANKEFVIAVATAWMTAVAA